MTMGPTGPAFTEADLMEMRKAYQEAWIFLCNVRLARINTGLEEANKALKAQVEELKSRHALPDTKAETQL